MRASPSHVADHSDYLTLISLELDGMLDAEEKTRLDRHLETCESCRVPWRLWRVIDQKLRAAPTPEPAPDFARQVAARLACQERRRNIQLGIFLTLLTVFVWAMGLVGVCGMAGALVYANLDRFAATGQFLMEGWAVAGVVGQSLWAALAELMATPTALQVGSAYLVMAGAALAVWILFIQRSAQPVRARGYGAWRQSPS